MYIVEKETKSQNKKRKNKNKNIEKVSTYWGGNYIELGMQN